MSCSLFWRLSLFSLLLLSLHSTAALRWQSIGVRGRLLCGSAPTPNIRIRLWDDDMGELVDTPAESAFTDGDGRFEYAAATLENPEIDAVVRIAHDCNDGVKPGQRLFRFKIPRSYISAQKEPEHEKYFDLGVINLEFKPYNEERVATITRRRRRHHFNTLLINSSN